MVEARKVKNVGDTLEIKLLSRGLQIYGQLVRKSSIISVSKVSR
jgi:hypothetical protein